MVGKLNIIKQKRKEKQSRDNYVRTIRLEENLKNNEPSGKKQK